MARVAPPPELTGAGSGGLRRLTLLVGAIVFVDTLFYAVVTPLLPAYARDLGLSKAAAGVLSGAYPAGTLLASLPAGALVARAGAKRVTLLGLAIFGLSSLGVAFAGDAVTTDVARFAQGAGGACSWAGGLAWLIARAPADRRGELLGTALGAAIFGALLGPAAGTLAGALSPRAVFAAAVVPALLLGLAAARLPAPAHGPATGAGVRSALRRADVRRAMWIILVPTVGFGCTAVLAPLELDAAGATALGIGATFVIASAAEAVVAVAAGRLSDRQGRAGPVRIGLAGGALVLAALATGAGGALVLAALVVALGATLGFVWAPAMAALTDAAERGGVPAGVGFGLMNLAWAGGQVAGDVGGGALGKAAGDGLPYGLAAVAVLVALLAGGIGPAGDE